MDHRLIVAALLRLPDFLDPCPLVADLGWVGVDTDEDGLGNACDDDGDGFSDAQDTELGSDPLDANSTP